MDMVAEQFSPQIMLEVDAAILVSRCTWSIFEGNVPVVIMEITGENVFGLSHGVLVGDI